MKVTANYLYSGMGDYFGGFGCDDNQALLWAFYGRETTLRDIIDQWVEDTWNGAAAEDIPEDVTQDDVRAALLDMLTASGRADYDSDAISGVAADYAACADPLCCMECEAPVGEVHCDDCAYRSDCPGCDEVAEEDCEDVCEESPVTVVVIEWEECDDYDLVCEHGFWQDSEKPMDLWFWVPNSNDDDAEDFGPYFSEADAEANNPNII